MRTLLKNPTGLNEGRPKKRRKKNNRISEETRNILKTNLSLEYDFYNFARREFMKLERVVQHSV